MGSLSSVVSSDFGREQGTDRHRTSSRAVLSTHALALSACCAGPEGLASRAKNRSVLGPAHIQTGPNQ